VTLDGTKWTLYVNGNPLATKPDMPVEPWMLLAKSAWLGKSQFPADPPFQGQIDSVRIFARALSASEMAAVAAAGDEDLLCWYRLDDGLDGGAGTTARDSSANLAGATMRGDPSWDSDALWLDGADDYLQTPVANGPERTLAAWIHPLSSGDVTYIESVFDTDVPGQHGSGWGLDRGRLKVILDNQFWEPGVTVALGHWTHVALVFNVASARLYRDGSLAASISYSQGDVSRAWYRIGRSSANELYFHGGIRDARIYGRALAAEEVREIFEAGDRRGLFVRGDPNGDGALDLSDAVLILRGLFLGTGDPPCKGAADLNADLTIDMSDAIYELSFLFTGGPPPESPYPDCGRESALTGLGCVSYPPCE
jgi:hypothetical protein